jgi:hypothetical protein
MRLHEPRDVRRQFVQANAIDRGKPDGPANRGWFCKALLQRAEAIEQRLAPDVEHTPCIGERDAAPCVALE